MKKIVAVVVSAFIIVMILPQIFFSILNTIDGMLYVSFGILGNLVKLILLLGIIMIPIIIVIVLIKK